MSDNQEVKAETLSAWYKKRLTHPIIVVLLLIGILQVLLLVFQQREKNAELASSIESLSKIFSLAISQKNRPIIEMSAAFALQNSNLKAICIFENDVLQYMIPSDQERHCDLRNSFLFRVNEVRPNSLPGFHFKILQPRYPGAADNLVLLFVVSLLLLPIFYIIAKIRKVIEVDVMNPLLDSINNLSFDGLSKILNESKPFRISELNSLIKSYYENLVAIGEHIARESELEKEAAIGRVISQLSHDMRAPLGNIERLLYLPEDATIRSEKSVIYDSVRRMNSMIEALRRSDLDLIIERKLVKIDTETALIGLKNIAATRGIQLHFHCSVAAKIWVDSEKFERAWVNLISNAIDFAKSEIRFEIAGHGADLFIRVLDDGVGVADEFFPKLFQRRATHGKPDGTGLGLAYVRQIMRGHGGDVTYRRENGLTVFECRLPNAIDQGKGQDLETTASLKVELQQKIIRKVAICIDPADVSSKVLARMASFDSDQFFFFEEAKTAQIVVSNQPDLMVEVLERDDQEYVSVAQMKGDVDRIVAFLVRKFELT